MGARRPGARGRTRAHGWLPIVAGLLLAAGCGGERVPRTALPDSVYMEVMARMVLLDSAMTSPAEVSLGALSRDSARSLVLERHGVTREQLLEFARTLGEHPRAMAELWQRIQQRADSLAARRWNPVDGRTTTAGAGDSSAADTAGDAAREDSSAAPGP